MKDKKKTLYLYTGPKPTTNLETVHIESLASISNGSVDTLVCESLDGLSINDRRSVTDELLKKVKINGTCVLKTINPRILAKFITNDKLENQSLNEILPTVNSVLDDVTFHNTILSNNNFILIDQINTGIFRKTTAQRIR